MKEHICKSCQHYNGQCQNFYLSRRSKTKRKNGNECEYWEERKGQSDENEKYLKAALLDIANQLEKIAHELNDDE